MAPSAQAHQRSHSLLLLQKLLNQRDSASPLTLILDSLEQSAAPLVREFTLRAKLSRSKVVFVSSSTVKKPRDADIFIKARGKSLQALASEIAAQCPFQPPSSSAGAANNNTQKYLIIIDSLNPLAARGPTDLPGFFQTFITPAASVVAVYHADVPLVLLSPSPPPQRRSEYDPHPLTVVSYMATTVFRVSSLHQALEVKRAQSRSLPEPEFGLGAEGREGVLVGLVPGKRRRSVSGSGLVVDMEMRRRSGRAVAEKFILQQSNGSGTKSSSGMKAGATAGLAEITLLSDHPLFAPPSSKDSGAGGGGGSTAETGGEGGEMDATFNLGLTEKQRRDREGIVLPYFDAQTDIGAGEGGRILYDMGREDDFDEEEDEI